jgi:hypothetical protein
MPILVILFACHIEKKKANKQTNKEFIPIVTKQKKKGFNKTRLYINKHILI